MNPNLFMLSERSHIKKVQLYDSAYKSLKTTCKCLVTEMNQ